MLRPLVSTRKNGSGFIQSIVKLLGMALFLATAVWGQSTQKVISKSLAAGAGGLTFDQKGDLYGVDQKLTKYGAIFRLHRLASGVWAKTILYHFTGQPDGVSPQPNLVFDAAGNLYGTTANGGDSNSGTVFQLTPSTTGPWTERVLYNFEVGPGGFSPSASVIIDGNGILYGATFLGPGGTIYNLVPNADGTWTHNVLYTFTGGADGGNPFTGLVRDSAGNLFGATHSGGAHSAGTIFELSPQSDGSWTFNLVYTLCSRAHCTDGASGDGSNSVTVDSHGNLYVLAAHGGHVPCGLLAEGCGVAFKLNHTKTGTWSYQSLHVFCVQNGCPDGTYFSGALTVDAAGTAYGTASSGGANRQGVVFRLSHPAGMPWTEDVLYSFCSAAKCADGAQPIGSLAIDAAGNLFGTTQSLVFEVTP